MTGTVPPRPRGCLWDIVSALIGYAIGIIIFAAIIAAAAWALGFI